MKRNLSAGKTWKSSACMLLWGDDYMVIGKLIVCDSIEPVTITLATKDNRTERTTSDRMKAHEAVDRFFDFHEAEYKAKVDEVST